MPASLPALVDGLRASRGVAAKHDIAAVVERLGIADPRAAVPVGDDCAAIPDGDGFLLLAIEGFISEFVERDPWFAGWCGIMVNLSDIYAMGGRPIAVVDAVWGDGASGLRPLLDGLQAASETYRVPIVGGHSNARAMQNQLAVAVLGRAQRLLSSFAARPGDALLAAIDLRGDYRDPYPHWNATDGTDPARLRGDLELLPQLAEAGLSRAAKDISQAGVLGTALMLLESSGIGACIDVAAVPKPPGVDAGRWLLQTFPSYGFLLSVDDADTDAVLDRFHRRGLAAARIGRCDATRQLRLRDATQTLPAWDFNESALTGCAGPLVATPPAGLRKPAPHAVPLRGLRRRRFPLARP